MHKNKQSESDISDKFIRPAMVQAGWHTLDQIYAQYPLRAGRVVVRGKTAQRDKATVLFADYVLFLKPNIPLAVVEAKKSRLSLQAGTQQAINYAELLGVPFSFASNGEGFVFRDATLATGVLEQSSSGRSADRRGSPIMTNLHNAPGLSQDLDDYRKFEQNERFNDMFDDGDLGDYALMLRRPDGTETPSFQHGAAIECVLNIHRKLDEVGDVHITGYTVATVLSKSDGGVAYETPQCKRHRFAKKQSAGQGKLFGLPE